MLKGTRATGTTLPLHVVQAGGLHYAEVRAFLMKYYGAEQAPVLIDPMHTVTSRDRIGLVTVHGEAYEIADIGMRMLAPRELYRAWGFPNSYRIDIELNGKPVTKTAQVRVRQRGARRHNQRPSSQSSSSGCCWDERVDKWDGSRTRRSRSAGPAKRVETQGAKGVRGSGHAVREQGVRVRKQKCPPGARFLRWHHSDAI